MDHAKLRALLDAVAAGEMPAADAADRLRTLPFEDLGFAKIDHHRSLRRGHGETVFAQGKTPDQVLAIVGRMREHGSNVLATRCTSGIIEALVATFPEAASNALARCVTVVNDPPPIRGGYIAVLCAGTSDLPVAEEAAVTCEFLGNRITRISDIGVAGLHRVLRHREEFGGANAVIVCAGMEGALPSVVAGLTDKPVIAVPTSVGYGASFGGLAALLGMLNSCAEGVAVVNIDNGFGAAVYANLINRLANGAPE
ncbi:MAG: nickel pincer cofactor biosynthesis protein LarB [Candidatus Hydrogenedentales bacterium]